MRVPVSTHPWHALLEIGGDSERETIDQCSECGAVRHTRGPDREPLYYVRARPVIDPPCTLEVQMAALEATPQSTPSGWGVCR
jgi:hypothetical protein